MRYTQDFTANMGDQTNGGEDTANRPQPLHEYDVYVEEDRITFVKKSSGGENLIADKSPLEARTRPSFSLVLSLFFLLSTLFMQTSSASSNTPTALLTIFAKSQHITLTSTLQLGRVVSPITLSQSQTAPTTGHGHQGARRASGIVTFYNGSFSSQMVDTGMVLRGADGVQVVTDARVTIPPNNPPQDGQASITAHALFAGSQGNIQALDINATLSSDLYVRNLSPFTHGQDARDFQVVTQADINTVAAPLKTTLTQSVNGALQGQVQDGESLHTLPCTPTVTSDHQVGEEAITVKVTASETCSAVAYHEQTLLTKATQLLTTQASKRLGAGYSLLGDVQVGVTQATVTHTTPPVVLTFSCVGTWVYGLSQQVQQHIKSLIAGKPQQEAIKLLLSLSGIERVSLTWDETPLPTDPAHIRLWLFYLVS